MKQSQATEASSREMRDRRTERRFDVEGEVCLAFDDPCRREVTGHLLDCSRSGFRAVHHYSTLSSGQLVKFEHLLAGGEARVVWNRILAENIVETGFVVLFIHPRL